VAQLCWLAPLWRALVVAAGGMADVSAREDATMSEAEPTYGEKLVRIDFNPSGDKLVQDIKQFSADIIDMVESNKHMDPRLAALAITSYECAAMWAVKMATTKPPG
jgi:hypothetical protein